jgi:hypothetical protein
MRLCLLYPHFHLKGSPISTQFLFAFARFLGAARGPAVKRWGEVHMSTTVVAMGATGDYGFGYLYGLL